MVTVTDWAPPKVDNSRVTPDALTRTVQDLLGEAAGAGVLENGTVAFDLGQPKSSISGETNKCLLQLWSPERNMGAEAATFRSQQEIVFGLGAEECVLEDRNFQFFVQLLTAIGETRHPHGPRQHRLFRLHPECWLESLVVGDLSGMDEHWRE
jgi:hypothetical protein